MVQHKSIGERLRKAKSPGAVGDVARDWGDNWRRQQHEAVQALFSALDEDDVDTAHEVAKHINDLTHKGFDGLQRVIDRLVDVRVDGMQSPASRESGSKLTRRSS